MEKIILTDDLFLGKGAHKEVFIDPRDEKKCIKILFEEPDIDWERERKYRKSRQRRHLPASKLLTAYYGEVATNKGTGYVFERVVDFDGTPSIDMMEFMKRQKKEKNQGQAVTLVRLVLKKFKAEFLREKVITTNMQYENFLLQRQTADYSTCAVRIIDNIGTHSKLPLVFYLDFLALEHNKRYWQKFIDMLVYDFPDFMKRVLAD